MACLWNTLHKMEDGRQLNLVWCLTENWPDWSYRQTCLRTILLCNEAGQSEFRSLLEENYFMNTPVRLCVRARVYASVARARDSDWEKNRIPFFFFFLFLFFFFFWHYFPLWTIASSTTVLHCSLSCYLSLQFLTPFFLTSSLTQAFSI